METQTKELGFQDKLNGAVLLVEKIKHLVIKTKDQFLAAQEDLKTIRTLEADLEAEYKSHPVIIEAKNLQALKGDIARLLENARKDLKNGPMLRYEQEQERILKEKEERIAAEMRKKQQEEAAKLAKEKEREAAEAKKRGDKEAAAMAKQEAAQIKADAATADIPVVVLPDNTPKEKRRTICVVHLDDEPKLIEYVLANPDKRTLLTVDATAVRKYGESLGEMAKLPGVRFEFKKV